MPGKNQKIVKKTTFQVGNYPPGRLPFGYQSPTPVGRNAPRIPQQLGFRPYMGKQPQLVQQVVTQTGGGKNRGRSGGGGNSKLLSMSDFLGNQPFSVSAAYGSMNKSKMAKLQANANTCVISHRELLLGNLPGSTGFTVQLHQKLNPGLSGLSSWLAAIAADYEEYEFEEFGLEYITRSPSNTKGSIGVCFDYDPTDPAPATELEASQMVGTQESNVWNSFVIRANPSNMRGNTRRKFLRQGAVLGDPKNFDSGSFTVYTNDCADTSSIGKVWMFYKVRFFTPQSPNSSPPAPSNCSQFISTGDQTVGNAATTSVVFSTTLFDALDISVASGTLFTPPKGAYRISGVISISDSVGETLSTFVAIRKNLSDVGPVGKTVNSLPADGVHQVSVEALVQADGTDTFSLVVHPVAATGTIKVLSGTASLIFAIC